MAGFEKITVVSVAGDCDGRNAVWSISRSVSELPGSKGLLIAPARPENLPEHIDFTLIDRINYPQYMMYVIHCLYYHIHTEYALIVQDDGWILNGSNWKNDWFDYDYIGAPTHAAGVEGRLWLGYSWVGRPDAVQVMNGGFSLRSRKFLEAPTKYGICYNANVAPVLMNEDVQLSVMLRGALETKGLTFAPPEVALHFSAEYMHPIVHKGLNLANLFGHHSRSRRLKNSSVVDLDMTVQQLQFTFGEEGIVALLKRYGYTVNVRS